MNNNTELTAAGIPRRSKSTGHANVDRCAIGRLSVFWLAQHSYCYTACTMLTQKSVKTCIGGLKIIVWVLMGHDGLPSRPIRSSCGLESRY
ncbi:hypothetical protein D3C73_813200 [compost metagenome]